MRETNVSGASVEALKAHESEKILSGFKNLSSDKGRAPTHKVVVGMSGGVDSSVAALLLKNAGYDVIGLFMHNWEESDGGACTSADDWSDVQAVCGKLNIPHYSVNFSEEYMRRVFLYFLEEYRKGRTPNPDVLCNREIKFGPFLTQALALGADWVATGHYCAIAHGNHGGAQLMTAQDKSKDQTYFLNQVRTQQLQKVLFPLGGMQKEQVRKIAEENGLVTARKKDSTGICFIGERNFKRFLSTYLPATPGEIRDTGGKKIGMHDGLMYYTLGQRRGLGIGGVIGEKEGRWYVVEKRLESNTLVVSCGEGEELLSRSLETGELNIIGAHDFGTDFDCTAKFRYRQSEQAVRVKIRSDGTAKIDFATPQRAVTPGQYAVLYLGDRCLGGAVIEKTFA